MKLCAWMRCIGKSNKCLVIDIQSSQTCRDIPPEYKYIYLQTAAMTRHPTLSSGPCSTNIGRISINLANLVSKQHSVPGCHGRTFMQRLRVLQPETS